MGPTSVGRTPLKKMDPARTFKLAPMSPNKLGRNQVCSTKTSSPTKTYERFPAIEKKCHKRHVVVISKFMWPESSWTRTEPNLLRSWSFEFPFPRHFSLGTNSGVGLSPTGHLFLTQICHLKSPSPKIPCWLVGGFFTNPIWNICSHQIGLWFPQGSDWT